MEVRVGQGWRGGEVEEWRRGESLLSGEERRVSEVAQRSLKWLGGALVANGLLLCAGVQPFSVLVLSGALGWVLLDRVISFLGYQVLFGSQEERYRYGERLGKLSVINVLGLAGPAYLIHESGHALAALSTLKRAAPAIHVTPFKGGMTRFQSQGGLTALGKVFGLPGTLLGITAAGIAASTLFALMEFAIAYFTEESHPSVSQFLRSQGVCQILNEVCYGLSWYTSSSYNFSHDFVRLNVLGGIHPLIPVALMILAPLVEHLALGALVELCASAPTEMEGESC